MSQWPRTGAKSSGHTTISSFSSQRRCPDTDFMMIIFFSMLVLLSPQHNFSFHEINSDCIKFHLFETKI